MSLSTKMPDFSFTRTSPPAAFASAPASTATAPKPTKTKAAKPGSKQKTPVKAPKSAAPTGATPTHRAQQHVKSGRWAWAEAAALERLHKTDPKQYRTKLAEYRKRRVLRTIQRAQFVRSNLKPTALRQHVAAGRLTLAAGELIAKLPDSRQKALAGRSPEEIKRIAAIGRREASADSHARRESEPKEPASDHKAKVQALLREREGHLERLAQIQMELKGLGCQSV